MRNLKKKENKRIGLIKGAFIFDTKSSYVSSIKLKMVMALSLSESFLILLGELGKFGAVVDAPRSIGFTVVFITSIFVMNL